MKKNELIKKLLDIDGDFDVCAMNAYIEDDASCPGFEIESIELHEDDRKEKEFISLQFADEKYLKKRYNNNLPY